MARGSGSSTAPRSRSHSPPCATSQHTFREGLGWEECWPGPRGPGAAAARSGPPLSPGSLAGGGRTPAGGVAPERDPLASRLAGVGQQGPAEGGDLRSPVPADGGRRAPGEERLDEGGPCQRLQHRPLDGGSGDRGDRQGHRRGVPPGSGLEAAWSAGLELGRSRLGRPSSATTRRSSAGCARSGRG